MVQPPMIFKHRRSTSGEEMPWTGWMKTTGGFLQRGESLMTLFVQHMSTLYYCQSTNFYVCIFFFLVYFNNEISGKMSIPSRSCHDHLVALHRNWADQVPLLADMYLSWKHGMVENVPENENQSHTFTVLAVETNGTFSVVFLPKLTIFQNCSR